VEWHRRGLNSAIAISRLASYQLRKICHDFPVSADPLAAVEKKKRSSRAEDFSKRVGRTF